MLMLWLFHIICPDVSLEHRPLITSVHWPWSSRTCLLPTCIGLPSSTFHYSLPSLPWCCVPVVFTIVAAFALLCCLWLSHGHGILNGISFLDHSFHWSFSTSTNISFFNIFSCHFMCNILCIQLCWKTCSFWDSAMVIRNVSEPCHSNYLTSELYIRMLLCLERTFLLPTAV